jgi:hypothetical protein
MMGQIELLLDGPAMQKVSKETMFTPTFKILNGESRSYPCDPRVAVDSANLTFEAFTAARVIGYVRINVHDDIDATASISYFLHGRPLLITMENAPVYFELASALGIPLIAKYALQLMPTSMIQHSIEDGSESPDPPVSTDDADSTGST